MKPWRRRRRRRIRQLKLTLEILSGLIGDDGGGNQVPTIHLSQIRNLEWEKERPEGGVGGVYGGGGG